MARKKVASVNAHGGTAVIEYDREWMEYVVLLKIGGKLDEASAYHTDDLDDAKGTAKAMLEWQSKALEAA